MENLPHVSKLILFIFLQSLHFINHRRYFFNESNRDINCSKADEIYSLKYKHQHRKDIVSVQFNLSVVSDSL